MDYDLSKIREEFDEAVEQLQEAFNEWHKAWLQPKMPTHPDSPERRKLVQAKDKLNDTLNECLK